MNHGNPPGVFGRFELKGTLNWMSLIVAVVLALLAWGIAELVPFLEAQGGTIGIAAGILAVVLKGLQEWFTDNEGMKR